MAARMARDAPSAFCRVGPRHIDSCPSKHVSAIRATSSGLVPSSTRINATRCPSCSPIRQSCGVPSPCAGRWLRIDAAHAAMSRDGERRRCYSIRIAPATRACASARRPVRHRCFSARHANTMDSSRDCASTGRGERGVFESATVGMVEGMEISVVRAVCAVSTVPAVSADSSAASGPSTPAGLSRSSTLSPSKATSQAISKSSISPQLAPDSGRTEADIILTSLVLPGSTVTVTSIGMHSAFGRSTTARPACRLTPVGQHDETEHEGHRQHMAFEVVRR